VLSCNVVEELAVARCDITVVLSGESVSPTSKILWSFRTVAKKF
jgi:hypothetical protein